MDEKKNEQNEQVVMVQPVSTNTSRTSVFLDSNRFEQVQRACRALTQSDLVPDMYKVSQKNQESKAIANCMIALDMADRMGANPLMVMQNMYIVYGRPSWSSAFMIATVNSCGRFKPLKFMHSENGMIEFNGMKTKNLTCYAYTTEKGDDAELRGATISLAMAKSEGWLTKNGSKWLTMPEQMLVYRAAAFWVRTYAPEISMGIYTAEENEEIHTVDAEYRDVSGKPSMTPVKVDIPEAEIEQKEDTQPTETKPAEDDCGY